MKTANLKEKVVLLIDDDEDLLECLVGAFGRECLKVVSATNGEMASEILKQQKVDLILSDMQMPKMNGLELLEFVRTLEFQPLFIIFTGYATDMDKLNELKPDAIVEKPASASSLIKLATKLFESS